MNKYYKLLKKILAEGQLQQNKKGNIKYLLNQVLSMGKLDLFQIFDEHRIAKGKLSKELDLYMLGQTKVEFYNDADIFWWDYCAPEMINTYPNYFKKLPALIDKINKEKRPSKNYILMIGETGVESSQIPCINVMHFQISNGGLFISVFQRSADSNLGLPSDIYQTYLISQLIDIPLSNITYFISNAHIYEDNLERTFKLLRGERVQFNLNV